MGSWVDGHACTTTNHEIGICTSSRFGSFSGEQQLHRQSGHGSATISRCVFKGTIVQRGGWYSPSRTKHVSMMYNHTARSLLSPIGTALLQKIEWFLAFVSSRATADEKITLNGHKEALFHHPHDEVRML